MTRDSRAAVRVVGGAPPWHSTNQRHTPRASCSTCSVGGDRECVPVSVLPVLGNRCSTRCGPVESCSSCRRIPPLRRQIAVEPWVRTTRRSKGRMRRTRPRPRSRPRTAARRAAQRRTRRRRSRSRKRAASGTTPRSARRLRRRTRRSEGWAGRCSTTPTMPQPRQRSRAWR